MALGTVCLSCKQDIYPGLKVCEQYEEQGMIYAYLCASGISMEFRDTTPISVNIVYPCNEVLYPGACFRYKTIRPAGVCGQMESKYHHMDMGCSLPDTNAYSDFLTTRS